MAKARIAQELKIGEATVYRILVLLKPHDGQACDSRRCPHWMCKDNREMSSFNSIVNA